MKRVWYIVSILSVILVSLLVVAAPVAAAVLPVIDFASDTPGWKPNGWQSADSAVTYFTDSVGADLIVGDWGHQSHGHGLAVYSDYDMSALIMDFAVPLWGISLEFGNDDPGWTNPGDEAILTLYNGATQVGQVSVVMNRNDIMDQTISFSGSLFDKAEFYYDATGFTSGLIEVVDNIILSTWDGWVTGGGHIKTPNGKKTSYGLSGNAAWDPVAGYGGQLHIVDHNAKMTYRLNTIVSLEFSGSPTESPDAEFNTARIEASGFDKYGNPVSAIIVIQDIQEPGAGYDTMAVVGTGMPSFAGVISGGNFQIHPPED